MNKELARYFVKLIAEDLRFSFNGMGIPSYSCEWLENQFIQENFNEIEEFIKKRYDEHENSAKDTNVHGKKRKHKLRTMTNDEFCDKWMKQYGRCGKYFYETTLMGKACPFNNCYSWCDECYKGGEPCKLPNGKYILIEVAE